MRYKIVDERNTKGIILTAESLLDLKYDIEQEIDKDKKEGAKIILQFLEDCYNKAHNQKPKKSWW